VLCTYLHSCLHYGSIVVLRSKVKRARRERTLVGAGVNTHVTEREPHVDTISRNREKEREREREGEKERETHRHTRSIDLAGVPGSRSACHPMQLWDSSAAGFGRPRPDFALDTRHAKSAGMRFRGRGETRRNVVDVSQTKGQFCLGRDIVCRESSRAISTRIIALRDDLRPLQRAPLPTRHTHAYCLTRKIISSERTRKLSHAYNREIPEEGFNASRTHRILARRVLLYTLDICVVRN